MTIGYSYFFFVVKAVNGVRIRNLRQLVTQIRAADGCADAAAGCQRLNPTNYQGPRKNGEMTDTNKEKGSTQEDKVKGTVENQDEHDEVEHTVREEEVRIRPWAQEGGDEIPSSSKTVTAKELGKAAFQTFKAIKNQGVSFEAAAAAVGASTAIAAGAREAAVVVKGEGGHKAFATGRAAPHEHGPSTGGTHSRKIASKMSVGALAGDQVHGTKLQPECDSGFVTVDLQSHLHGPTWPLVLCRKEANDAKQSIAETYNICKQVSDIL
eukprot:GHVT01045019.1.p2 GENE.GHVT01045019.1~~GHVT01045019.1.p2  ORF type:complete len:267 (-),score=40.84 GHVT01045019.1:610-1410(-)